MIVVIIVIGRMMILTIFKRSCGTEALYFQTSNCDPIRLTHKLNYELCTSIAGGLEILFSDCWQTAMRRHCLFLFCFIQHQHRATTTNDKKMKRWKSWRLLSSCHVYTEHHMISRRGWPQLAGQIMVMMSKIIMMMNIVTITVTIRVPK